VTEYVSGTLVIEVYRRMDRRLVWRGAANADVYSASEAQRVGEEAVRRVLDRFPAVPPDE
jgi:hypothetical protein